MTLYIGNYGGATRTRAGLYDGAGMLLEEVELRPVNPLACGNAQSSNTVAGAISALGPEGEVVLAVGLAGVGEIAWRAQSRVRFALLPRAIPGCAGF